MNDFEQRYLHRQAIYRAMQQSQEAEWRVAQLSAEIAIRCKGELLIHLSAWLLGLNSANALTAAEREEVQCLTQMSLEKWIQLQAIALQAEDDLTDADGKEKEATALLNKKAPYGTATKMFADAESKMQIRVLQSNVAVAQKQRETSSTAVKRNVVERQRLGEMFLRDCLAHWEELASTQALGKEARVILDRMTREISAICVGHNKQMTEVLNRTNKHTDGLYESHKDPTAAPSQQYKTPPPQEQNDEHKEQGNFYDFKE